MVIWLQEGWRVEESSTSVLFLRPYVRARRCVAFRGCFGSEIAAVALRCAASLGRVELCELFSSVRIYRWQQSAVLCDRIQRSVHDSRPNLSLHFGRAMSIETEGAESPAVPDGAITPPST